MRDFQAWKISGFCPICQKNTEFVAKGAWLRDELVCTSCPQGSIPRERALALVLNELRPDWRGLHIHESSPVSGGISAVMKRDARHYIASQYFPDLPFGSMHKGVRNEDLENLTFGDCSFDITVTLDVMEHVYHPDKVVSEVFRTLRPGGIYICTFPVRKSQTSAWERRFIQHEDGTREHLKEPEIHGNPVSNEGSIVTVDYGYDLHLAIAEWAAFDVRVYRFADRTHGILGEYTDLIVCTKPASAKGDRTAIERTRPETRLDRWLDRLVKRARSLGR
ncbi:methyltransferase domain-containing protein [Mesorhizobium sp. B2-1-3A]|uniref:class I SAM-dependent methyltransferase n=1 Tax=Mesorhizobium sp. B2-1-3A TaxID=2589971 RepID=UPI0011287F52|nr:methyltransferase domain-containing protein [Mesorhizobium sp. B2-1-3A]TPM97931.1 class I SAM-dependent methyltransferase [Mesorhizobium sp. B2-1-3A]